MQQIGNFSSGSGEKKGEFSICPSNTVYKILVLFNVILKFILNFLHNFRQSFALKCHNWTVAIIEEVG